MNHDEILRRVADLTVNQLFNYIRQDIVTLQELKDTGNFDAVKRKNIMTMLAQMEAEDDGAWQKILDKEDSDITLTIGDYTEYIAKFPAGKHRAKADSAIGEIIAKEQAAKGEREKKLNNIKEDRNCCRLEDILRDINAGIISEEDLIQRCNIPQKIVDKTKKFEHSQIEMGEPPQSIPEGFTEVYFWGIVNSGKTCALSAILNTAESEGYLKTGIGSGLSYLNDLKNIFREDIGVLPEGTSSEKTQYLPFTLQKDGDKYPRSVSLIELSGEIFQCFVAENEGKQISDYHIKAFDTVKSFLRGRNRKIHFFFIDYNPEAISHHTRTQSDYMSEAAKWIEKNRVFADTTNAIYLVITKSDMIDGYRDTDKTKLGRNIDEFLCQHFKSFRKNLKTICVNEKINGGNFEIIPFSIGDVYFTRICEIKKDASKMIINRLFNIQPQKKSILDFVIN